MAQLEMSDLEWYTEQAKSGAVRLQQDGNTMRIIMPNDGRATRLADAFSDLARQQELKGYGYASLPNGEMNFYMPHDQYKKLEEALQAENSVVQDGPNGRYEPNGIYEPNRKTGESLRYNPAPAMVAAITDTEQRENLQSTMRDNGDGTVTLSMASGKNAEALIGILGEAGRAEGRVNVPEVDYGDPNRTVAVIDKAGLANYLDTHNIPKPVELAGGEVKAASREAAEKNPAEFSGSSMVEQVVQAAKDFAKNLGINI